MYIASHTLKKYILLSNDLGQVTRYSMVGFFRIHICFDLFPKNLIMFNFFYFSYLESSSQECDLIGFTSENLNLAD